MRKTISLLLILLLAIGLTPLAFADNDDLDDDVDDDDDEDEEEGDDPIVSARKRAKTLIKERALKKLSPVALRERVKNAEQISLATSQNVKTVRTNLQNLKKDYKTRCILNNALTASLQESIDVNCLNIRKDIKEHTKNYLLKQIDHLTNWIEKTMQRIEASDISEENAKRILEDLEEIKVELGDLKTEVETFTSEMLWSEYQEARKELIELAKKTKNVIKKNHLHLAYKRLNNLVTKLEHFGERIAKIIERLESEAKDVSELNEILERFNAHVSNARENLNKARESWVNRELDKSKEYFKRALESAKEAIKVRKELISKLREVIGVGVNAELKPINAELKQVQPAQATQLAAIQIQTSTAANAGGDQ